jgi:hypothetical protein
LLRSTPCSYLPWLTSGNVGGQRIAQPARAPSHTINAERRAATFGRGSVLIAGGLGKATLGGASPRADAEPSFSAHVDPLAHIAAVVRSRCSVRVGRRCVVSDERPICRARGGQQHPAASPIRVDPAVEIADRAAVVTAAQVDGFANPLLLG